MNTVRALLLGAVGGGFVGMLVMALLTMGRCNTCDRYHQSKR